VKVRAATPADRPWIERFVVERWGGEVVVAHGEALRPHELPAFVAEDGDRPVGLVTYRVDGPGCEVVTIDAVEEGQGVGTALLEAAVTAARAGGCRRVWLITTNDNLGALRFYQRRGFRLAALRPGAVGRSRRTKPEIPEVGRFGIPIRDEIELELRLERT
jgi:ribosomal protein S18 acetylase RimI-like enzyme